MTFKKAIEFKKSLNKDTITKDGLTMRIFVTPANHDDFSRYVKDYRTRRFTDKTATKYSLNGQFKVYGLWTNGIDVIHKELTK